MKEFWKYLIVTFGIRKKYSIIPWSKDLAPSDMYTSTYSNHQIYWEEQKRKSKEESTSLFDDRIMEEVNRVLEILAEKKHDKSRYVTRQTV